MSNSWEPLYVSILDSTIWTECDANVTKVWLTLMLMADRKGVVSAPLSGLAKRACVSKEECQRAIKIFLEPDPDSRTKEHEGRRIVEIDGGWVLLNKQKYKLKAKNSPEGNARRQQTYRNNHRNGSNGPLPHDSNDPDPDLNPKEEIPPTPRVTERKKPKDPCGDSFVPHGESEKALFEAYRGESGKTGVRFDDTRQTWLDCSRDGVTPEQVRVIVQGAKKEKYAVDRGLVPSLILGTSGQRTKYLALARADPDKPKHEPPQPNNTANPYPLRVQ